MSDPISIQRPMPPCVATLGERGTVSLYHLGEHNRCGSCGATQWFIGRNVAECAMCDAAIPLVFPSPAMPATEIPAPQKEAA